MKINEYKRLFLGTLNDETVGSIPTNGSINQQVMTLS
jgi:hypothetical protein